MSSRSATLLVRQHQRAVSEGVKMIVNALYAACSLAGLVMVVGGIWLLAKQKVYLDHETKQPIEVEMPGGIRLKANSPALALFLIGFVPLLYPVQKLNPKNYHVVENTRISGSFDPQTDAVVVYASVAQDPLQPHERKFSLTAPFVADEDADYKMLLISNNFVLGETRATRKDSKNGEIVLTFPSIAESGHRYVRDQVDPLPPEFGPTK